MRLKGENMIKQNFKNSDKFKLRFSLESLFWGFFAGFSFRQSFEAFTENNFLRCFFSFLACLVATALFFLSNRKSDDESDEEASLQF